MKKKKKMLFAVDLDMLNFIFNNNLNSQRKELCKTFKKCMKPLENTFTLSACDCCLFFTSNSKYPYFDLVKV